MPSFKSRAIVISRQAFAAVVAYFSIVISTFYHIRGKKPIVFLECEKNNISFLDYPLIRPGIAVG
jgi:hypothetical protein